MLNHINYCLFQKTQTHLFKEIVRYKRSTAKRIFKRRTTLNPGIEHQSRILNDVPTDRLDTNNFDELETLESDFMNLEATHKEHMEEVNKMKEKEKVWIVKQKYFKQFFPNFLTWSDKEQIKHLHTTNPEEWTIEKLSEGFPALPETIKKIVKATWTKNSAWKIVQHDSSVKNNWELLKNRKLNLPPDLTEHLLKFTKRHSRHINQNANNSIEIIKKSVPRVTGEFSEIIRSYEVMKQGGKQQKEELQPSIEFENKNTQKETPMLSKQAKGSTHTTLEDLKTSLRADVKAGRELEDDDMLLLKHLNEPNITEKISPESELIDLKDIPKTAVVASSKSQKDNRHLLYPEKIIIPKDKLKPHCTYKLNDCFYDSNGWFLYRVPGMEK